jgi:hypothetical protein
MNIKQEDIQQITTDDSRTYVLEIEGKRYEFISVTSVINYLLNKPAIPKWAYNVGVEEATRVFARQAQKFLNDEHQNIGIEAVELIERIADAKWRDVQNHLSEIGRSHDHQKFKGADRGTLLHARWEAKMKKEKLPDIPKDCVPYDQQFDKFIDDYAPEVIETEMKVVSFEQGYAGTLDLVAKIGKHPPRRRHPSMVGKTVVLDYKTNKDGQVYPMVHLPQADAYHTAYEEMGGKADGSMVVAFGPEKYHPCVNYYEKGMFKKILEAYNAVVDGNAANPNARKKK